ncbi:L,D-transpeptidase [Amorphus orientalis]|uniref:Lipoprotein-anchoring transpeptidase ErfK/SrfK n=1 Tax=Amorphus orientalis TaxID=649198 RepID=A0AAE3VQ36_9HYPH|nr:L,D-transpeptidase [Amorphus orientalis]MDQ0316219.1 lipoprotein-anchoring transpeptidase ErfK/SrfK [Amorphus orientalis]
MIARRLLLAAIGILFFTAGLAATADAQQSSRVYDPSSKQWIVFDPDKVERDATARGGTPERFKRKLVPFRTSEPPGTIIIDTDRKYLFYVLPNFQAIRYGVGVGKEGFGWSGEVHVGRKAEWPSWTPTPDMIERDPDLREYINGMPGGVENPLGARALYLYKGNRDSLYRIHGTNEPWSIGLNVSSGCIRMNNEDVEDLYSRAPVGTKVIVLKQGAALFQPS